MNTDGTLQQAYAAIYDKLDQVLPEFEFYHTGSGWKSGNVRKLDGREGKTKGQVICTDKIPTRLVDHSESQYMTFWDYVQLRDGLDNGPTYAKLLDLAGMDQPKKALTAEQLQEQARKRKAARIWEAFVDCCKDQLLNNPDATVKDYLLNQRKYTPADAQYMELGQAADWSVMERSVMEKTNFDTETVREVLTYNRQAIGFSHKLIIPIRNAAGQVEGVIGRNVNYQDSDKLPKYVNSTGLKKGSLLYGLTMRPKNKKVVLVEGQLDAGVANARGLQATAAAIGGKDITEDQVRYLLRTNAREVVICLDNEAATKTSIERTIKLIQQLDQEYQIEDRIYVATLPAGIKDADQLVTVEGIEALEAAVYNAMAFQRYLAEDAIQRHAEGTDRHINDLIDEVVSIAATIKSPAKKDDLHRLFVELLQDRGIMAGQDALQQSADRIKAQRDQQEQEDLFKKMLKKAEKLAAEGDTSEAIDHIQGELHKVRQRSKRAEYEGLFNGVLTEDNVYRELKNKPEGAHTGIHMKMDGELIELEAPTGQLTFFAAPMNHGKTGIMLNIALNVLERQPKRAVHFFTFEMDAISVLKYALNVYIGEPVSTNNRRTINTYLATKSDQFIKPDKRNFFHSRKDKFFSHFINSGRFKIYYQNYSVEDLIGFVHYIRRQDPHAVIIIDYIQKLRSDRKGDMNARQTELKLVCEDLNTCAIDTQLPIIMASQFNRTVQNPMDMHATNMAEASDIEKIASEIYGLWNCIKKIAGKPDKQLHSAIEQKYGVKCDGMEERVIVEILKSRQYTTGAKETLNLCTNSGKIGGDHVREYRPAAKFV